MRFGMWKARYIRGICLGMIESGCLDQRKSGIQIIGAAFMVKARCSQLLTVIRRYEPAHTACVHTIAVDNGSEFIEQGGLRRS